MLLLVATFALPAAFTRKGKGAVRSAMAPAERGTSGLWQRLSEAAAVIRGIGGAVEKNHELAYELVRVQAELNKRRDVEDENIRLRKALDFHTANNHSMIPCDVVSRNISGWWSSVRIGKGYTEGIGQNCAVISPDGLVGKTTEVSPFTSEVLLVSDPACRISAKLARINAFGLVRGDGADLRGHPRAIMQFINKDADIRVGDEVVTSGLSGAAGVFPKGVHIGYIETVNRDESGLFQSAEIIPRATIGLLDYVFVVSSAATEVKP